MPHHVELLSRAPLDVRAAKALQQEALQQFRAAEQQQASSAPSVKSFDELTGHLPKRTEGYAEHAAHYHRFLGAVSATLGDISSPDEVAAAAAAAFRALQSLPPPPPAADGAGSSLPPGLPPRPAGPPGLGSSAASQQQASASASIPREAVHKARSLLAEAALRGLTIGDEAVRTMLVAHAPLMAWLKRHRQPAKPSGGGAAASAATPTGTGADADGAADDALAGCFGAEESVSGAGDASAGVDAASVRAYHALLQEEADALAAEEAAVAAAAAAAAAEAAAAQEEAAVAASEAASRGAAEPAGAAASGSSAQGGGGSGGDASPPAMPGSVAWVRELCRSHLVAAHADEGGGGDGVSEVAVDLTAATVISQLTSPVGDDALQENLLNLLGFGAIEMITAFFPMRADVQAATRRLLAAFEVALEQEAEANGTSGAGGGLGGGAGGGGFGGGSGGAQNTHGPMVGGGCGVSMTSQSAQRLEKQRRKDAAKVAKEKRRAALEEERSLEELAREVEWLAKAGFEPAEALLRARDAAGAPAAGTTDSTLAELRKAASVQSMSKAALPDGTQRWTRRDEKGSTIYEEVQVPPTPQSARAEQRLVAISELPEYAQLAFKGVKSLNQLQSAVASTALYSQENMLVCAPTGAGKTNVAMLAVMQQVGMHMEDGRLDHERLKMVYIAPMKALAQEIVGKFSHALKGLGLVVKEYTGDVQLTKRELAATNLIVTTPEKWDVTTRKGSDALVEAVGLLIIDEVHLLNDDRGPVIEALVARTLRLVESSQQMIRIVGLSATLPNYADVALFLKVNPTSGLFHFGPAYRPVPLTQTFVGVTKTNVQERNKLFLEIAYDKALNAIRRGKQVMVFVHARNDTARTARALVERAKFRQEDEEFKAKQSEHPMFQLRIKEVNKSRSPEVKEFFSEGFGIHHAGMLRADRTLSEKLFADGLLNVLVCTATLAWGVNLPAHTVRNRILSSSFSSFSFSSSSSSSLSSLKGPSNSFAPIPLPLSFQQPDLSLPTSDVPIPLLSLVFLPMPVLTR